MISFATYSEQLKIAPLDNGISYWEKGNGPVLLFLHGALGNGYTWRKILPELSQHFRCIAIHLPLGGHQIALSKQTDLSPAGISRLLNDFVEYLKLDRFTIVANDTGGAYAQVFASLYPQRIRGMILSNCEVKKVFPPASFVYLRYAVHIPYFLFVMSRLFSKKKWLKSSFVLGKLSVQVTSEELSQGYVHSFVHDPAIRDDFKKAVIHWRPYYTITAAKKLQTFQSPVLIIWGGLDTSLFPKKLMQQLLNVFPHAEWQEIPEARTYIQEDAPEKTIQLINKFINEKLN
ncbi:alpha/beta fold hydrolase [Gynurincola endophyticus]|uniref:alpha/beta fold hydrolase n=1 Tax=Gynurincola endophyticus TaxID=2479004 RepID=UPI000F8CD845|nr:alpha/beta hydrolase [Gynurincola endophyticus]